MALLFIDREALVEAQSAPIGSSEPNCFAAASIPDDADEEEEAQVMWQGSRDDGLGEAKSTVRENAASNNTDGKVDGGKAMAMSTDTRRPGKQLHGRDEELSGYVADDEEEEEHDNEKEAEEGKEEEGTGEGALWDAVVEAMDL